MSWCQYSLACNTCATPKPTYLQHINDNTSEMDPIDKILSVLAPHECLVCVAEGQVLCKRCYRHLPVFESRCYICRVPSVSSQTCATCRRSSRLESVFAATEYSGLGKLIVMELKLGGARAAAKTMAQLILDRNELSPDYVLVPLPTASSRVRWRGFDQAKLIARHLSSLSGLTTQDLLLRHGQQSQHGFGRNQRLHQLKQSFSLKKRKSLPKKVLLVDDVVTTGATLEIAASILINAGVETVRGVVFAQPELRNKLSI